MKRMLILAALAAALPLLALQASRKIYSVSDGGVKPPRIVHKSEPRYSPEAKDAKIEGIVVLSAVVETDGRVTGVQVVRSLETSLDEQAVKAIRSWVFEPATKDDVPVPVKARIEINFRLI
jgi:periplasmic protein TonB